MTPTISSHNHMNIVIPAAAAAAADGKIIMPISALHDHHNLQEKRGNMIKYKECMKNQAIAVGGNATDGCGEFLADGEEGTIQALSCSACHCHRNFHRKEIASENNIRYNEYNFNPRIGRKKVLFLGHHHDQNQEFLEHHAAAHEGTVLQIIPSRNLVRMAGRSESDEQEEEHGGCSGVVKKRFRTKFTQEQKEKMHDFAEKVGWKIHKVDESVVQSFCQQVGVKRRVLRVWMHNNKHNINVAKKINQPNDQNLLNSDTN
ncbi:zinc-finger homeodomain protein 4-like [Henckelia pumila]|uniref:zinc-finger homeodomain protein 4-like n=1 Tax=Henckelia pumila TaxID=405737 RepID=UPI003C6E14B5